MNKMRRLIRLILLYFKSLAKVLQIFSTFVFMLVFLDIDGVMVPTKSWQQPPILEDGFYAFSEKAVTALNTLLTEHTTIILTSSHRNRFSVDEWKSIFLSRGITCSELLIAPTTASFYNRSEELLNWFQLHQVDSSFLIIDDDSSLQDLPNYLKRNLISPAAMIGLTMDNVLALEKS